MDGGLLSLLNASAPEHQHSTTWHKAFASFDFVQWDLLSLYKYLGGKLRIEDGIICAAVFLFLERFTTEVGGFLLHSNLRCQRCCIYTN